MMGNEGLGVLHVANFLSPHCSLTAQKGKELNLSAVLLEERPVSLGNEFPSKADDLYDQLRSDVPLAAQEIFRKICDFNLDRERQILQSAMRGFDYSASHVEEMEDEYKKYLLLRLMYPKLRLPMSKDVDDFWHVHVLNTRSYQCFTEEVGKGIFLHHGPTIDEEENMSLMPAYLSGTLVKYEQYFGEPNPKFWKRECIKGACCGC